ncbi:MAG: radical SAM protein [Candidatus Diapherotrites archaeon]
MKISFIIPPAGKGEKGVERIFGCNYSLYYLPPIAMLGTATLLKEKGFEVNIRDLQAENRSINYFKKFIEENNADFYIFFTVFLSEKTDFNARKIIREINPKTKFIFTGTQPTWNPKNFLDKDDTFVIRGEHEIASLNLLNALKRKKAKRAIHNFSALQIKDISVLPIPDRSLLNHKPYFNPKLSKLPHTTILTSRGCFGRCTFCVPNALSFARELEYKKKFNTKPSPLLYPVERVIKEFQDIAGKGFKSVTVIDDEFVWNEKRTSEICNGIKDLGLEWYCYARADMITERNAKAMAEAGCKCINLGIESFNQKILDAVKKDIKVESYYKAIEILKKYKIEPEINILFGATPLETTETIEHTLREAEKLNVNYALYSIASPFPGTEFYFQAKRKGWIATKSRDYEPIDPAVQAIISYPHLSRKELEYFARKAYRNHYLKPKFIAKQLLGLKSLSDLKIKMTVGARLVKRNLFG